MGKANIEKIPLLLLTVCLAIQVTLSFVGLPPWFGGDEPYYVAKAEYFATHHRFPRATAEDLAIERGQLWGQSDWRPQGYPLLVAICSGGHFSAQELRPRMTALQSLLMALAILMVFQALRDYGSSLRGRLLTALVLGLAPWPFEFASLIGPDSAVASLTAISIVLLARRPGTVFLATLLFSITFIMRPEMIVMPPLMVACAALLQGKQRLRFVALGASAFVVIFLAHYLYRIDFTGQRTPPVFGGQHIPDRGAFRWVNTWIGTEQEAYEFVYGLTNHRDSHLPTRAFANETERRRVDTIVAHTHGQGYSPADDAAFANLAERRKREHPVLVVLARAAHTLHLWVNIETNTQLLHAIAPLPRTMRRVILGGTLVGKLVLLTLFVVFLTRTRRLRGDPLTLLFAIYVIARTLLLGAVLGWFAHRFVVNAWLPLLACVSTIWNDARSTLLKGGWA